MAVRQTQSLFKCSYAVGKLNFSISSSVNNKWRLKNGLEPNPNRYGPLKLLSDYSFVDGRLTPLGFKKLQELKYQQKLCASIIKSPLRAYLLLTKERIVELNNELDVGLQQYYERQEKKKQKKAAIIENKLKPKGVALLKKNKNDLK